MLTKWDILQERLITINKMKTALEMELKWMEETPFTANGTGKCSQCGIVLATEADFAKHFIVSDPRYVNLGYCPNRSK